MYSHLISVLYIAECSSPFGSQNTEWNDFLDVYKLLERLRKKQQSQFYLGVETINIFSRTLQSSAIVIQCFLSVDCLSLM